jgi:hypothetical protein
MKNQRELKRSQRLQPALASVLGLEWEDSKHVITTNHMMRGKSGSLQMGFSGS